MSSWGYTDNVAIAGTVTLYTANANVVGSSTYFTSNVKDGDYLLISGRKYQVSNVVSNTNLFLTRAGFSSASGATAYLQQGPKYVGGNVTVYSSRPGRESNVYNIENIYGVDLSEMQTSSVSALTANIAGNYTTAAKTNTTVTIATTGASQPTVNATATINYTNANVTSFTITNPGAGYTTAAQSNTTVTISTSGATIPSQNATADISFTSGTAVSNASHTGWTHYTTYIDANGNVRKKSEVLVAMSKNFTAGTAGDFEDTVFPD
jgi:hypothetical protein